MFSHLGQLNGFRTNSLARELGSASARDAMADEILVRRPVGARFCRRSLVYVRTHMVGRQARFVTNSPKEVRLLGKRISPFKRGSAFGKMSQLVVLIRLSNTINGNQNGGIFKLTKSTKTLLGFP